MPQPAYQQGDRVSSSAFVALQGASIQGRRCKLRLWLGDLALVRKTPSGAVVDRLT